MGFIVWNVKFVSIVLNFLMSNLETIVDSLENKIRRISIRLTDLRESNSKLREKLSEAQSLNEIQSKRLNSLENDYQSLKFANSMLGSSNSKRETKLKINNLIKDKNDNIIDQHDYNAEGKRVFISLGSKSLGDTLAWFPVVEEFRKKHNCKVIVSTFHNDWFEKNYPQLEFVAPGTVVENIYAMYQIGWWYKGETDKVDYFKHSIDFRTLPLQKTASNILGVEHKEIIPKVTFKKGKRPIKGKYICFSPHASASAKYWHNIYGWQTVVDYLNEQGYKVIQISKEKYNSSFETTKLPGNKQIKNVIDATGLSMEDTVNYLSHCELYIGVSSGLAWLSWSVHTPVVMVSGFSSEWTEFTTNVKRVINKDVCNSCFNNYRLDAGDWNWCPAHKDTPRHFECTRKISPESVIECIVDYLV